MGFIKPEVFVVNNKSTVCQICEQSTPKALAFINSQTSMWKNHRWTALGKWFSHPEGGNLPEGIATEKKLRKHLEKCLGGEAK